jgi:tRNA threonylcarbamoyladenosine biosynthesis protein TsaB
MTVELSVSRILAAGTAFGPVLGIDTGSPIASLGVVADGRIQAALSRSLPSHCAVLPDLVEEVLSAAGTTLRELKAVAVALGPGSFTGLRIGLSYAKGLVLATNCGMVGVPTLDAIALCMPTSELVPSSKVCPVIDARKGEIYTALYQFVSDALQKLSSDLVAPLKEFVSGIDGDVLFVGDSKAEEARALAMANGVSARTVETAQLELRGCFVAALGAARAAKSELDDAASLEPLYVRPWGASVNATAIKSGEGDYGTSRGRAYTAVCRS